MGMDTLAVAAPSPTSTPSANSLTGLPPPLPLRRTTIDYTPFFISSRYTNLSFIARGSGTVLVAATDGGGGGVGSSVGGGGGGRPPRRVAIKKVPEVGASATTIRQLLREVRILRAVSHPHLLRLIDVAATPSDGGVGKGVDVYLVTPLAEGGDLAGVLAGAAVGRRPPLTDANIRRLMGQTLAALAALHSACIVHRDVKPDNIFLTGAGADGVGDVLLGDFGLSRYIAPRPPRASRGGRGGGGGGQGGGGGGGAVTAVASATAAVSSADDAGLTQGVATRGYRAPELTTPRRRRPTYDASMDLWGAGVVLAQALLPGCRIPGKATSGRPAGWAGGKAVWDVPSWVAATARAEGVPPPPPEAVDLLRLLLSVDPATRPSAAEAAAHPYVAGAATPVGGVGDGVGAGGGGVDGHVRGGGMRGARLEPPAGADKAELGALLWAEVTAFHPELEDERPLLGGGAGEKKRRRGLVALLRRR